MSKIIDELVEEVEVLEEDLKVDFDAWYAAREKAIPAVHLKEILMADFKGRKMAALATMAEFDEALKKYGVKLG